MMLLVVSIFAALPIAAALSDRDAAIAMMLSLVVGGLYSRWKRRQATTPLGILGSNCKFWVDRTLSGVTYGTGTNVQQINDLSGLAHHAINVVGLGSQPTQASAGAAFAFNGTSQTIDVADHADIDFTTALVVGLKCTPNVVTGNKSPLAKSRTNGDSFSFQTNASAMRFHVGVPGASFGEGGTMTAGVATYFLIIFDGAGGSNATRLVMRKDGAGVTLGFSGSIPSSIPTGADNLRLGAFTNGAQFWDGTISAAFAANVVPSAGQITALEAYLAAA